MIAISEKAHPWHGVDPCFKEPDLVDGVIEIPRGSRAKYEVDKASGLLRLDRVLYSSVYYPANYGIVPRTLAEDGDPLDIMVLSLTDIMPLSVVSTRVIGVMRMMDGGVPDDKLLAVAVSDPSVAAIRNVSDVPLHLLREVQNFFKEYKKLEGKQTAVEGFLDKAPALTILTASLKTYVQTFRT